MNEKERQEKIQDEIIKGMYKIFDKLEQRISKLEKVLASHAKRIGEMDWQDRIVKLEKCLKWKTFINADDIIQEDKDESKI